MMKLDQPSVSGSALVQEGETRFNDSSICRERVQTGVAHDDGSTICSEFFRPDVVLVDDACRCLEEKVFKVVENERRCVADLVGDRGHEDAFGRVQCSNFCCVE